MIDWNSVAVNIFSTSVIVGVLGFVLKSVFEKVLDRKFKESAEIQKSELTEFYRRKAHLFDQRFISLKTAVSLIYRARNAAREVCNIVKDKDETLSLQHAHVNEELLSLVEYDNALKQILFEERGVLPDEAYQILHDHKGCAGRFVGMVKLLYENLEFPDEMEETHDTDDLRARIIRINSDLDHHYEKIVQLFKIFMEPE